MRSVKIPLILGGVLLVFSYAFADSRLESSHSRVEPAKNLNAIQSTNPKADSPNQSANLANQTSISNDSQIHFVFNPDSLLNAKSVDFFNATSAELAQKTGINLYVYMANDAPIKEYSDFKNSLNSKAKKPFVIIVLLKNEQKIDIITSESQESTTQQNALTQDDKKKIYWEYMVPLLPSSSNSGKDSESGALSAVVFNGYVEAVDLIADKFGVKINHNISKDEKGAKLVVQGILYIMLFSLIGLFVVVYFFKHKRT